MHCHHCHIPLANDLRSCPACGKHLYFSPIELKAQFLSGRYLKFLFFSTRGRLNRERYITAHFFLLTCFLVYFILVATLAIVIGYHWLTATHGFEVLWSGIGLGVIIGFAFSIPLKIKRAHDINLSPHWCWLWLLPGVSLFTELWFMLHKSSAKPNPHGFCPIPPATRAAPKE